MSRGTLAVWTALILILPHSDGFADSVQDGEGEKRTADTALLFFISYQSRDVLPAPPSPVRAAGYRLISSEMEESGSGVVPWEAVEPFLQAWRVRSGNSFSRDFLMDISARLTIDRLLVATLTVYSDRLLLSGRSIQTGSGLVEWVDQVEIMFPAGSSDSGEKRGAGWERTLEKAVKKLFRGFGENREIPEGPELLVLPVTPVGTDRVQADLATGALFRSLVESRRWRLPDPAVTVRYLQDEGHLPHRMGEESRRLIETIFGVDEILVPGLYSYELEGTGSAIALDDDITLSPAQSARHSLYWTLVIVDIGSGELVGGAAEYLPEQNPVGLFGVNRDLPLARRFGDAADRIVDRLIQSGVNN